MVFRGQLPDNTDLADVPAEWIDQDTVQYAGAAQALADGGNMNLDTDSDGVTDAGELIADTDPLNADDHRTMGLTEDIDPAFSRFIDDGTPDIVA